MLQLAGLALALALIPSTEGQLAYLYPPLENSARHAGRSVAAVTGVGSCGEAVANNSYCALRLARGRQGLLYGNHLPLTRVSSWKIT